MADTDDIEPDVTEQHADGCECPECVPEQYEEEDYGQWDF